MAKLPTPKIAQRVKVSILPSSDAKENVELDYRMMIVGDFSKKEPGAQGELKDRTVYEIKSKGDFKAVLENINPKLTLNVPNHISGEKDAKVSVNIDVKDMKDFHPDEICKKVEPLQELMEARERLKKLKYMVMNPDVRKALEGVLKEGGDSVGNLMSKLEAKS
ncbi:type VI secretion system contractile sheath small subunit [candidate division KSB1 bacterium]|nr:MAG: type VI secretion system contractile sheath small subunit [candidate division KSB1 bacterium]